MNTQKRGKILFSYFPQNLLSRAGTILLEVMPLAEVEMTKMSSRGQIVIPQSLRNEMRLSEGEAFAIARSGDSLILKRIKKPSREEIIAGWRKFNAEGQKIVKKLGIKEKDVDKIIHYARGRKQ